ncbi:Helitron helicase [Phytophthora megakarya]|uniref:ATP-dependent DNA helicase n=1 Tax=Phytophthora megakarya TaxID=4795 RepID=A0A225VKE1_9STRA|nr:Helitron helicase [Phytophthora megakarya]
MAFLSSAYQDVSEEGEREDTDPMDVVANEIATYEPEDLAKPTALADQMNEIQKEVFDQVIKAVGHPIDGQKLFFVDGPGGTGKSFLLEQMLAHVHVQKKVPIAVASSGIVATLLTGGHTAHSTVRIRLKLSEFSTCSLPWQSQKAELIRNAKLISWDEAPMMHRACFEAVDTSFRDIMKNDLEPSGGKVMVFSGDHRQIVPKVRLTKNMRVRAAPDQASVDELAEFSEFYFKLARVATQSIPTSARTTYAFLVMGREERKESEDMEVPPNFNLLPATEVHFEVGETNPEDDRRERNVNALIDAVYPGVGDDNLQDEYFVDRAILAPTNASVRRINEMIAERLTGAEQQKNTCPSTASKGLPTQT